MIKKFILLYISWFVLITNDVSAHILDYGNVSIQFYKAHAMPEIKKQVFDEMLFEVNSQKGDKDDVDNLIEYLKLNRDNVYADIALSLVLTQLIHNKRPKANKLDSNDEIYLDNFLNIKSSDWSAVCEEGRVKSISFKKDPHEAERNISLGVNWESNNYSVIVEKDGKIKKELKSLYFTSFKRLSRGYLIKGTPLIISAEDYKCFIKNKKLENAANLNNTNLIKPCHTNRPTIKSKIIPKMIDDTNKIINKIEN